MVDLDRERGSRPHAARAPSQADAVVLATGAWLAGIPELKRAVVAVSSDMVATAPMPERLEEAGWTGGESISDCRLMVHYYRTTKDGRIAFGQGGHRHVFGGRVDDGVLRLRRRTQRGSSRTDLVRLVPVRRRASEVTHSWGGPIDRTVDGAPIFGSLPGRVPIVYAVGYSGNGVAPSADRGQDPRLERARPRRRVVGLRPQPRAAGPVPARADPLRRRLRRPRGGAAQGAPRGRGQDRRPAHAQGRRPRAAGLLPRRPLAAHGELSRARARSGAGACARGG